jgi:hypothetical protein
LDSDKREVQLLTELNAIVAVLELLVGVGRILVDSLPVDDSGRDLVKELEEGNSVTEIFIESIDIRLHSKTVHPVSEGLLLSGLLDDGFEFDGGESGPGVEEIGNEGQIQLLISLVDIFGGDEFSAVQLFGSCQNHLGSLQQVRLLESVSVAVLGSDLSEEHRVVLCIFDITREIVHFSIPSCCFQMIVEPSEEDLFNGELEEVLNGLSFLQKSIQLWMIHQIDSREQTNLHNLPDKTQDEMGFSFHQILGTNVDDVATNGLGGLNAKGLILSNTESVEILLVEDSLVDRFGDGIVDEFAKDESIVDSLEEGHVVSFDGKMALQISILFESIVDIISERYFFFIAERVSGRICGSSHSLECCFLFCHN